MDGVSDDAPLASHSAAVWASGRRTCQLSSLSPVSDALGSSGPSHLNTGLPPCPGDSCWLCGVAESSGELVAGLPLAPLLLEPPLVTVAAPALPPAPTSPSLAARFSAR